MTTQMPLVLLKRMILMLSRRGKLFLQGFGLIKIPTDDSFQLPCVDREDLIHHRADVVRKT